MSTGIEWTDETWNPVTGCTKVSPGCDHCYAEKITERFSGKGSFETVVLHPDRLEKPLHWRQPRRVFVNSMSDLFHDDVPTEFIARCFGVMGAAERHTFQILTKRPGRMSSLLRSEEFIAQVRKFWWSRWFMVLDSPDPSPRRRSEDEAAPLLIDKRRQRRLQWAPERTSMPLASSDLPWPLPNVWVGTSVEDQKWANVRIPKLIETPASVRFLSCEPLLGPLDLHRFLTVDWGPRFHPSPIDWVIVGGESGPGARPMHPEWARSLRDQCLAAGVAFFFKQWGEWYPTRKVAHEGRYALSLVDPDGQARDASIALPAPGAQLMVRVGKKAAGRELDGRVWDEMPDASATMAG